MTFQVSGGELAADYVAAKGDEEYGGVDGALTQRTDAANLEWAVPASQPLIFDGQAIEQERWALQPDGGLPSTPHPSPTWYASYDAFKRGEQLALPYFEPRPLAVPSGGPGRRLAPPADDAGGDASAPGQDAIEQSTNPAAAGYLGPGAQVTLPGVVAMSQKFLIAKSSSGECIWGAFLSAPGFTVKAPYSGILATSVGSPAVAVNGSAAKACPVPQLGQAAGDAFPDDVAPATCSTCRERRPPPVSVVPVAGLLTDLDGHMVLADGLEIGDSVYYVGALKSTDPCCAEPTYSLPPPAFTSIAGFVHLDFCNWTLAPVDKCQDLDPPSADCASVDDAGPDAGSNTVCTH